MSREMTREILIDAEHRMRSAIQALEEDLAAYRTGRAAPQLLDRVTVTMYGADMPLNQVAVISVPEPTQLAIRPYDQNQLSAIERAILKSDLGLTPNNDGKIIRLNIPRLTEERRRELSRQVGKRVEEARVAIRNVRRDALNDLRDMKNENMIAEDLFFEAQDDLQKLTDKYIEQVDKVGERKEKEIMEV